MHGPSTLQSDTRGAAARFACVHVTSGSTGQPKGVPLNHRHFLYNILQYTNACHISPEDRLSLLSSPSTIIGVLDIYGALLNGASVHILPPVDLQSHGLVKEIKARRITIYHSVPTLLRRLVESVDEGTRFESVRLAYLGADRVEWSDVAACRRAFASDVFVYTSIGSTECSTYCRWFVDDALRQAISRPPVGWPDPNRTLMIVDGKWQPGSGRRDW